MIKENLLTSIPSVVNDILLNSKYAIFDIETTGLSHIEDDMLEVAVSVLSGGKVIKSFHSYIHTEKQISPRITAINKITNSMLTKAPNVQDIVNRLYSDFSDCIFVAHNGHNFDAKFILQKSTNLFSNLMFLDTRSLAEFTLPGLAHIKNGANGSYVGGYSMTNLCNLFGIKIIDQHTAKGDVDALVVLFKKLIKLLENPSDIQLFIKKGSQIKV